MLVLSIESSCDETSAAVVDDFFSVKANIVYSQLDHAPYGGVVPEIASRAHMRTMVTTIRQAMMEAAADWDDLSGIAVTCGPGLVGSLIVGVSAAKGIALASKKPLVGVHHMEGHIFSNLIEHRIKTPFLTLLVSGGHTELVIVKELGSYQLVGRTRDDAAGEAFDKVAKLLGLLSKEGSIAGGRIVSDLAKQGNPQAIRFPRALKGEADFSFSGLKTSVLNYVRKLDRAELDAKMADIAASFQAAVVGSLVDKTIGVVDRGNMDIQAVCLAGGVAANQPLREALKTQVEQRELPFYCPSFQYCTDNAAMIGAVGVHKLSRGQVDNFELDAAPRMSLC